MEVKTPEPTPEALACVSKALHLSQLASSPTNPRKTFDDASMAELIENVRQHGILQPILVRIWPASYPWKGEMPLYEVVAGERRFRAAKAAGLSVIPGMVRDLGTRDVLEIQVIENLQRVDLHPMEEAEGYGLMMHSHGYTAEDLAAKIGKSRSYIFGRLKLLDLDEDSRRLFRGGVLNASTALLVARIPSAKLRVKAIKEITAKDYNGDALSVRAAQRLLQNRYMLRLAEAPFALDDASLPGGACAVCPKRTGNIVDLFEDVESPDVCTDPDCHQVKKQTHIERQIAQAKKDGAEVISGKDAAKIAPNGFQYSNPDGFTKLDSRCYDDAENRTYREIFGDHVETVLFEDARENVLVPVIKNTLLADKLLEAGIGGRAKREKERVKLAAKVEVERDYRWRLFTNVRTEIANYTLDDADTLPAHITLALLRNLVRLVYQRSYDETVRRVVTLWDPPGANITEKKAAIAAGFDSFTVGECWSALVDLLAAHNLDVTEYSIDQEPEKLLAMATLFSIDAEEVRKDVVFERKEQEKAEKRDKQPASGAKKSKKATAEHVADPFTPAEAAQAGEILGEGRDAVRVRIRYDIGGTAAWKRKVCGKEGVVESLSGDGAFINVRVGPGKDGLIGEMVWNELDVLPPATEAAQAREEAGQALVPADAGIIEMNETPSEDETTERDGEAAVIEMNDATPVRDALKVGDRVRIQEGVKGPNRHIRKVCGREGVIESFSAECYAVRLGPGRNGLATDFGLADLVRVQP